MLRETIIKKLGVTVLAAVCLISTLSGVVCAASAPDAATTAEPPVTPTGIAMGALEEEIDAVVDPYIGKLCAGAAIIVTKDGKTVFSKGYGYADVEQKIPVDPDTTAFEWGSVSKTFVWTSVMQLKEKGLIDLGASISEYLPGDFYKKLDLKYDVTMLDLMNHRAGFEEVYHDLISTEKRAAVDLSDALLNYVPRQVYKPDTVSAYSNYSTALAAYIVECVAQQRYTEYVKENILRPLEMDSTGMEQDLSDAPQLLSTKAVGYKMTENGDFQVGGDSYVNLYAAGSMTGTAADLAGFVSALCSPEHVLFEKKETMDEMFSDSYRATDELSGSAHGFWPYDGVTTTYCHVGNTLYFSSYILLAPQEEFGVVILTNEQYASTILRNVSTLLLGDKAAADMAASAAILPDPAEFEGGTYISARSNYSSALFGLSNILSMITVEKTGENSIDLASIIIPSSRYSFVQTSPGVFTATGEGGLCDKIFFARENGHITAIVDGSDTDFVSLNSVEGMSREKGLVSLAILALTAAFCLISLPVYLVIAIVSMVRKSKHGNALSQENRRLRFAGRLTVFAALTTFSNLFVCVLRVFDGEDFSKGTTNMHAVIGMLTLALFLAACGRLIYLFIRGSRDVKKSVAVKSILTSIFIGAMYFVLALWNFFAII